ncbi:MAG: class IV adenylate cyclase [Acidobacteriia bacterium]|nr:class IV adenylate cyclase [Terriglobia bacterium]
MSHDTQETEIKLAVPDANTARRVLRAAGFRVCKRRVFEANIVFDTPAMALRNAGLLLRVRQAGSVRTLTYKGRPTPSKHKSREELELIIPDARVMGAILEGIGFRPAFRYEKFRTEYRQHRSGGVAMLDETPVGVYLELEGNAAWIDRTARKLGFSEQNYITVSYGALYLEWCRRLGIKPGDMVFDAAVVKPV